MKNIIVLALAAAAVAAALVWQHLTVRQFQEEATALRRQLGELKAAAAASAAGWVAAGQMKRLREEHGELLQLRGKYSQWKQKAASSSLEIESLQKQLDAARRAVE